MGADEFDTGSDEDSDEPEPTNAEEGADDDRTLRPETMGGYTTPDLEAEFGPIHEDYADLFFDDGPLPDEVLQSFRGARVGARASRQ